MKHRKTKDIIRNNDPVGEWIKANIVKTSRSADIIKVREMYEKYIEYFDGDTKGVSNILFKNILSCEGICQIRKTTGLYYCNVKIK